MFSSQEYQDLQTSFYSLDSQDQHSKTNQYNQSNRKPKHYKNRNGQNRNENSINHVHQQKLDPSHSGTVTLYNNHNKTFRICEFITMLNNIKTSKNIIDICNSINLTNPVLKSYASQYGLTYKLVFNGSDISSNSLNLLSVIKCDQQPILDVNIFKTIAYIKTYILYSKINKKYNNQTSEWVGILAGLILYFDELDMINRKKTNNVSKICKDLTSNDIE
uniref:Uncharacterized protein n=1 Tax=viral metagenome TaxID=1070528 RepID=A0A6C0EZM1_9ZZZZ